MEKETINDSLTRFLSLYSFLANEAKLLDDIVGEFWGDEGVGITWSVDLMDCGEGCEVNHACFSCADGDRC